MFRELNPYNAQMQKSVKGMEDNVKKAIYAYRAMGPGDLGYGYSDNEVEYIFITGAGDIEKGFPKFNLPIVDLESRKPTIITDLRSFAKSKLIRVEDNLEDMLLVRTSYKSVITTALLFGHTIQGSIMLKSEWYKAFSFFVTNMLTVELGLDPYDRTTLHTVVLGYMVDRCDSERDIRSRDIIISNNILLNGMLIDSDDIKDIMHKLNREDVGLNILIKNINNASEDRRLKKLTLEVLIGSISKLVIKRDVPVIVNSFEYPELFIPLLNSYINNSFLKKTKLVESFKYINRKVDIKQIDKELNHLLK